MLNDLIMQAAKADTFEHFLNYADDGSLFTDSPLFEKIGGQDVPIDDDVQSFYQKRIEHWHQELIGTMSEIKPTVGKLLVDIAKNFDSDDVVLYQMFCIEDVMELFSNWKNKLVEEKSSLLHDIAFVNYLNPYEKKELFEKFLLKFNTEKENTLSEDGIKQKFYQFIINEKKFYFQK